MGAHTRSPDSHTVRTRIGSAFVWLGGGHADREDDPRDDASYQVGGVVVVLVAALAWLVSTLAVASSTSWPAVVVVVLTLPVALVVAAVARAIATGSGLRLSDNLARAAVAVLMGLVLGELANIAFFSGSIDRGLDAQAASRVADAPAVAQADATVDRLRGERAALDSDVRDARTHRDDALVVARCEFNPSPACPPQKITGVPGSGPETKTANELLAGAQRELDSAVANRDREAPALDHRVNDAEAVAQQARTQAPSDVDRGLAARWTAMNDYTTANLGAMLFRLLTIAFFVLLSLLPLLLRLWRGETGRDRRAAAHVTVQRAELDADTAIAVKRAEVRAEAENLWAQRQLDAAREAPDTAAARRDFEHRRAVSRESTPLWNEIAHSEPIPAVEPAPEPPAEETKNLPAPVAHTAVEPRRSGPLGVLPAALNVSNPLPDITRTVGGLFRPFVPPVVTKTFERGNSTIRSARTVIEEIDEIKFSFTRRRKVVEEHAVTDSDETHSVHELDEPELGRHRIDSTRLHQPRRYAEIEHDWDDDAARPVGHGRRDELHEARGPRQLPRGQ